MSKHGLWHIRDRERRPAHILTASGAVWAGATALVGRGLEALCLAQANPKADSVMLTIVTRAGAAKRLLVSALRFWIGCSPTYALNALR